MSEILELTDFIWPAVFGLCYLIWIHPTHTLPPADNDSPYDDLNDF